MSDELNTCGCGPTDLDPKRPSPRPGLTRLPYRIARHSEHVARMTHALSRTEVDGKVPLAELATRSTDDPTIALIDAWASALEVLGFYQERIVQEGFLNTATERMSVLELARAIGYELAPGTAATTRLAFTVEGTDDPFREVEVPAGTPVMSVPAKPDTLPQTYETLELIIARADWNAIPARQQRPQTLALQVAGEGSSELLLLDIDDSVDVSGLPAGAVLNFGADNLDTAFPLDLNVDLAKILAERAEDLGLALDEVTLTALRVDEGYLDGIATGIEPGARLALIGVRAEITGAGADQQTTYHVETLAMRADEVEIDHDFGLTRVSLSPLTTPAEDAPPRIRPSLGLTFKAPALAIGGVRRKPLSLAKAPISDLLRRRTWDAPVLNLMLAEQRWPRRRFLQLVREPDPAKPPPLGAAVPGIYLMKERVAFFGASSPLQELLAERDETNGPDPYDQSWDNPPRTIWETSQGQTIGNAAHAFLEREVETVLPDSWAILEASTTADEAATTQARILRIYDATISARVDFAISGKVTGLLFNEPSGGPFSPGDSDDIFTFRISKAHVASDRLALAGLPITADFVRGDTQITLDRLVLDLEEGQAIALDGPRADAAGVGENEIAIIDTVRHVGGFTRLTLRDGLDHAYRRVGLRVNGNVALASHGESQEQILGSGDASLANQAFALMKVPLTFVPKDDTSGRASTLTVRVDKVAWTELPSLYEAGPDNRVYTVRIDDDGTTRVVFGDGVRGARLPSGTFNVTATYRVGVGPEGETGADSLINMSRRPLGIRATTNPDAAIGAGSPESLDDARSNAPITVRTLDRVVSVFDYTNAARRYPGIGKARTDLLWVDGSTNIVVSVGTETGDAPQTSDPIIAKLAVSIEGQRDPVLKLFVRGYVRRNFDVQARVGYDRNRLSDDVETAIIDAVIARFSFARQEFAHPVTAADVIATIQGVDGVVFVDLDHLAPSPEEGEALPDSTDILSALPARQDPEAMDMIGAELWLTDCAGLTLSMEAVDAV